MKTLRRRIQDAREAGGVGQLVIERDYAQSYVLYGLGETPELQDVLIFKGGSALKKVHFGQYRFSEDLDFSGIRFRPSWATSVVCEPCGSVG